MPPLRFAFAQRCLSVDSDVRVTRAQRNGISGARQSASAYHGAWVPMFVAAGDAARQADDPMLQERA